MNKHKDNDAIAWSKPLNQLLTDICLYVIGGLRQTDDRWSTVSPTTGRGLFTYGIRVYPPSKQGERVF